MNQYLLNNQRVYDASNYSSNVHLTFFALGNINKILTHLDKCGSATTANSSIAPPQNELIHPALLEDFVIQKNV